MKDKSTTDQILDLLLDALQERQATRAKQPSEPAEAEPALTSAPLQPAADPPPPAAAHKWQLATEQVQAIAQPASQPVASETTAPAPAAPPPRRETIYLGRMLGRLALGLILLILLVNIPFNQHGTALARAMPDQAALIVRDGLLLKGSGDDVYVIENNQRRWIASLDAFTHYGYRWENVHEVEESFLTQFEEGQPVYLLVKCATSPHVYAIENGQKRWIKDVPTFQTLGVPWESIQPRTCAALRNMADGVPIPADAGEPPQP